MAGISEQLNAAIAAHSRGDFKLARIKGEAALRTQPNNHSILQLVGVICCQAGDLESGTTYLRKAIAQGGDSADARLNLTKALVELDQFEEAVALCSGPIAEASSELQRMRADILKAQGMAHEAIWAYEDLIAKNPADFESWNNLGNARHERGDLEGALVALQRARQLDEKSSLVHANLGRLMISMDRYEEACLFLEKAALLAPQDPGPLLELGRALTSIDHAEAGLRALGTAARLNPKDPKIFLAIGLAFTDLAQLDQAERAYGFAIKTDRTFAPGYLNLGILLEKANRLDELDKLIDQAKAAYVSGDEIAFLSALARSRKGETSTALEIAQGIQSKALHATTLAQFIGQHADRLCKIDQAFQAFEDMNNSMAQSPMGFGVDRGAYQRAIEGLTEQTTTEWLCRWPAAPVIVEPPAPVFLVGFPRSGTTLLDTILMGHSATHVLEEIPIIETVSKAVGDLARIGELSEDGIADMRALYFSELEKSSPPSPGALVIDKNPLSMIRMPLIHRLFPDAKIILAMRHPCDVVLSCYMQNFKPTEAMASFLDLSNASRTYDRIFNYWEKCQEVFPLNVHILRYEAMVEDLETEMRPLFSFLGLPWEDGVLDHQKTATNRGYIRTPSYAQVTERIYSSASGRWARYRSKMNEVLPILQPWVERYGYSFD